MKITLRLVCLLLISLTFIGCGTLNRTEVKYYGEATAFGWISPQGRLVSDNKNPDAIETGHMAADMNYYYSGCDTLPTAVIKLTKDYTLDDARWQPLTDRNLLLKFVQYMKTPVKEDSDRNLFQKLVHFVRKKIMRDSGSELYGFTIKAYNARPIGVWYANKYTYGIRLAQSAKNKLYVYTPNLINTNSFAKLFPERDNRNELLAMVTPPPGMRSQKASIVCLRCHKQLPNDQWRMQNLEIGEAIRGDALDIARNDDVNSIVMQGPVETAADGSRVGAFAPAAVEEDHYQVRESPGGIESGAQDGIRHDRDVASSSVMPGPVNTVETAADGSRLGAFAPAAVEEDHYQVRESPGGIESGAQDGIRHDRDVASSSVMPGPVNTVETAADGSRVDALAPAAVEEDHYQVRESLGTIDLESQDGLYSFERNPVNILEGVPDTDFLAHLEIDRVQKVLAEALGDPFTIEGREELRAVNAIQGDGGLVLNLDIQRGEAVGVADLHEKGIWVWSMGTHKW